MLQLVLWRLRLGGLWYVAHIGFQWFRIIDESRWWMVRHHNLRFGSKPKCVLFMPGDQRWVYDLSVPSTVPNSATSDCFHLRPSFLSFLDLIVTLGTSTSPSICVKWFHRLWHFDCLLYWSYSALGDQNIDHERPPVHTHRAECIASSVVPGTSHHRFCILGPFTHAIAAPTSIAYQTPWRYHCDHALIIY